MCAATVLDERTSIKQRGRWRSYKRKTVAATEKKVLSQELSDQQSGLFSKCWRGFNEFSKLLCVREVRVHRK